MIDNTEAMKLRDRLLPPETDIHVIPNVLHFGTPKDRECDCEGEGEPLPGDEIVRKLVSGIYWAGPGENGGTPGDSNIAVGPNHVIACINGWVRFYTKTGASGRRGVRKRQRATRSITMN